MSSSCCAAAGSEAEVCALLGCDAADAKAAIVSQLQQRLLGGTEATWKLVVADSGVAGGGEGVHLRGACAAGTVLACYPGVIYLPEDLPVMHKLVLPGNEYVLARRDGVLLDGRPDGASAQIFAVAQQRDRAAGAAAAASARFACGNKVNHPPAGQRPNVVVYPFDLLPEEHQALHPFIPVSHFRPPAAGQASKQTAVFIATRALADEELYLDYKLRPDGPLEPWYHPVEPLAAAAEG